MKVEHIQKEDIPYLHYLRILAIFLVVYLHCRWTTGETYSLLGHIQGLMYVLTLAGVPLFIMISGALVFPKKDRDAFSFYKKRLPRLMIPLVFWGGGIFYIRILHRVDNF